LQSVTTRWYYFHFPKYLQSYTKHDNQIHKISASLESFIPSVPPKHIASLLQGQQGLPESKTM